MSAGEPVSRSLQLGTGLRYHVLEWGGDRPDLDHTVVLLHGFLDLAWSWEPTVRAGLAGRFHIVAPDLRGHGDTDWVGPGGTYHFLDYMADVEEIVGALGRARVSLVGHSMGGSVAAYYAGSRPERVHRLALLEGLGPPESSESTPDKVRSWLDAWARLRARPVRTYATVEEAAERLRARDPLLAPELALELARRGTRAQPDGRLRFKHDPLHAIPAPTPFRTAVAAEFWSRVRCPVLLVDGAESPFRFMGEEAERRARFLPAPERAVIAGAGHMMQRHQPATLADILLSFLSR
ncbi:MAG TPA: alpha/beta hydrolase [Kofleriaceae bacterium]|nr:alpha/beta hydrolase [Kofleriaceae bacterium]